MRCRCRGCPYPGWSRSSAPGGMRSWPGPLTGSGGCWRGAPSGTSTRPGRRRGRRDAAGPGRVRAGSGHPVGWLVITGDAEFFSITKRLHNQIHGSMSGAPLERGGGRSLRADAGRERGGAGARGPARRCGAAARPADRWPAAPLARAGARVVWRCHIGVDWENEATRAGWDFLRPHLAAAEAFVFSRREYVPSWIPAEQGVDHPAVDRPVLPEEPATRRRHRAGHPGQAGRAGWCGAAGARDVHAPRRRGWASSPGPRPSSARAARDPVIRCWSRSPAGTGSRTWPGSCAASPTM